MLLRSFLVTQTRIDSSSWPILNVMNHVFYQQLHLYCFDETLSRHSDQRLHRNYARKILLRHFLDYQHDLAEEHFQSSRMAAAVQRLLRIGSTDLEGAVEPQEVDLDQAHSASLRPVLTNGGQIKSVQYGLDFPMETHQQSLLEQGWQSGLEPSQRNGSSLESFDPFDASSY